MNTELPSVELVTFDYLGETPDEREPITIVCGRPGRSITFEGDPAAGVIAIRMDNADLDDEAIFGPEEFGLVAALLLRVVDGE